MALLKYSILQDKQKEESLFQIAGTLSSQVLSKNGSAFDKFIVKALTKGKDLHAILKLALHSSNLQNLLFKCSTLLSNLSIPNILSTDEEISTLATKYSYNIKTICLDNCVLITNRTIIKFSQHCPNLRSLSLKNCVDIK